MRSNVPRGEADANKQNSTPKDDWDAARIDPADAPRAVREYLDTLDEAAFGAASEVQPKFTSHSDPASQWTVARKGPAFFSYSDNYLIDTDHGVIVDVEATRSIRQAEVGSTRTMLDRVKAKFDLHPERLIADTVYGTGPMLGSLVDRKIAPHIPVFDKSGRSDGTWTRADFEWDAENDQYICPEGHELKQFRRNYSDPNRGPTGKGVAKYRALRLTCQACPSKAKCCPNADARSITREEHERASDLISPYLGETEAQIAAAFAEARQQRAFLIFDEADTFLSTREMAQRSWEVSKVNEMLTWMESHPQPFACTTNMADRLDPAALRRFTFRATFLPLTEQQRVAAFRQFFGTTAPRDLAALDLLTPGDFALVAKRARVLGIRNPDALLQELRREQEAKPGARAAIGFRSG